MANKVIDVQLKCSQFEQFELPTLNIQTKNLQQAMDEIAGNTIDLTLNYSDCLKQIEQSQKGDLDDIKF